MMKKWIVLLSAVCLLLAGCGQSKQNEPAQAEISEKPAVETEAEQDVPGNEEQSEPAVVVNPLPDTTMENLTDAILAISLQEGDAYVDDTGKMQMDLKIYTYDKYDMVDIAALKVGDTIETHSGEVNVASLEKKDDGTILINGGIEKEGLNLVTDDNGIFYEITADDEKKWYEVGEATIRVSTEFIGYDNSDPAQGEVLMYPGGFVTNEVSNYDFSPLNTTIRVENGQIIELNRW